MQHITLFRICTISAHCTLRTRNRDSRCSWALHCTALCNDRSSWPGLPSWSCAGYCRTLHHHRNLHRPSHRSVLQETPCGACGATVCSGGFAPKQHGQYSCDRSCMRAIAVLGNIQNSAFMSDNDNHEVCHRLTTVCHHISVAAHAMPQVQSELFTRVHLAPTAFTCTTT